LALALKNRKVEGGSILIVSFRSLKLSAVETHTICFEYSKLLRNCKILRKQLWKGLKPLGKLCNRLGSKPHAIKDLLGLDFMP